MGNEKADQLAKLGSKQLPERPNYKTQAYIASLHKCEMQELWRHKWSNSPNPLSTWFQPANKIPPKLRPTDRRTFSRLMQSYTGHAHPGEYYK